MVCGLSVVDLILVVLLLLFAGDLVSIVCYVLRVDYFLLPASCDAFGVALGAACCLLFISL